jgi:hypothetical protein
MVQTKPSRLPRPPGGAFSEFDRAKDEHHELENVMDELEQVVETTSAEQP